MPRARRNRRNAAEGDQESMVTQTTDEQEAGVAQDNGDENQEQHDEDAGNEGNQPDENGDPAPANAEDNEGDGGETEGDADNEGGDGDGDGETEGEGEEENAKVRAMSIEEMEALFGEHFGQDYINPVLLAQKALAEVSSSDISSPVADQLALAEERQAKMVDHDDYKAAISLQEQDPAAGYKALSEFFESTTPDYIRKLRTRMEKSRGSMGIAVQQFLESWLECGITLVRRSEAEELAALRKHMEESKGLRGSRWEIELTPEAVDASVAVSRTRGRPRTPAQGGARGSARNSTGIAVVTGGETEILGQVEYVGGKSAAHNFMIRYAVESGLFASSGLEGDTIVTGNGSPFERTGPTSTQARYSKGGNGYRIAAECIKKGMVDSVTFLDGEGETRKAVQHMEPLFNAEGEVSGIAAWREGNLIEPEGDDLVLEPQRLVYPWT